MNKYENKYKDLLKDILNNNVERADRTNIGCYSGFSKSLKLNLKDGFPILTGKAMYPKIFNTEFKWFINGETNIKRFKDSNIKIWDEWANSDGDLGPVYGHQMLSFNSLYINQLESVLESIKTNPDSRRHIITLWNPIQLDKMALPPCYLYFQFFVDNNKLNMFVLQRSADLFLGLPYDVALYSMFLLYVSDKTNYKANEISISIVDAHIYKNHIKQVEDYLTQPIYNLPKYTFKDDEVYLSNYKKGKKIKANVAV